MPPFLADILTQLKAISTRLDAGQRMTIAVVLLATFVGIGAIIWYSGQPTMTVLARGDSDYLSEVEKVLQKEGVPYTIVGERVMVDRGDNSRARSALNRGGVSVSGLDDKSFLDSMTSSAKDRAAARLVRLQQQAARALAGMHGVRDARVMASKPPRSPFRVNDRESEPRAVAMVRLAPGVSFRRVALSAVETVASTIGLPPENVTIIDMVTKARFKVNPDSPHTDIAGFRSQERDLEAVYQEKALQVLGPLRDKVRVTVTVFLDPEYTSARKSYIPPEPVLIEERSTKEDKKGVTSSVGGDPSVTSQVAGNQIKPGNRGGRGESTKKSTSDKKYDSELGTIVEGLMAPKIKKIALAITIDESIGTKEQAIKAVVMNAIGWEDPRDGPKDSVEVFITKFPPPQAVTQPVASVGIPGGVAVGPEPSTPFSWMQYLPLAGQLLGLLLVLWFLRSLLKRSDVGVHPMVATVEEQSFEDLDDEDLTADETAKRARREIEKAINEDPATISRMLEAWLAEQKA